MEPAAGVGGYSCLQIEDLPDFGHRECRDLIPSDRRRGGGEVFLDKGSFGHSHDFLPQLDDGRRQLEINRGCEVERHLDFGDRLLIVSHAGGHERVFPRLDVQYHVVAVNVRRRTHRRPLDLDAGADDRLSRLTIFDFPGDFPRVPGESVCGCGQQQDRQKQ